MEYPRRSRRVWNAIRCFFACAGDNRPDGKAEKAAPASSIKPSREIRVSAHGDGLVILHIPSGRVFLCNSTGSRIWNKILRGADTDAVSRELSRDFGVNPDLARAHATAFVRKLEQQGLLVRT